MAFQLSPSEQLQLQQWVAAHGTPQQVALRCQIVLAAASGESDVAIAEQLSVNRKTVILWRQRFSEQRLDALWEIAPGRGRKPTYDIDKIAAIVDATLQSKPEGMTHLSCRAMAKSQGVSKSTVNNIWLAHNLKPHRVETFDPVRRSGDATREGDRPMLSTASAPGVAAVPAHCRSGISG